MRIDVENGFVRDDEAADTYGVVLSGRAVDAAATTARREALRNRRSTEEFVYGPERAAYEQRLPEVIQDLVAALLAVYPAATRQFLRDRLYQRIEADAALKTGDTAALRRRLGDLLEALMQSRAAAD